MENCARLSCSCRLLNYTVALVDFDLPGCHFIGRGRRTFCDRVAYSISNRVSLVVLFLIVVGFVAA